MGRVMYNIYIISLNIYIYIFWYLYLRRVSGSRCRWRRNRDLFVRHLRVFLQETCVFLCHTRSSHLANMGLCRHGPQQRRLDQQLDLVRPPIGAGARPPQSGPRPPPVRGGPAEGAWCRGGHRPAAADHAWPAGPIIIILYSCIRAALSAVQRRALGARQIMTNNHQISVT